ncbi:MAG: putative glutamine amidotransferase [Microbacteriaceae bacterium]|nr:putative glutamine amidotransferase [Microbacteriaceae bacterium]
MTARLWLPLVETAVPGSGVAPRRPPLVGITASLEHADQDGWAERYGLVPETYLTAVERAGGVPVLLPPQPTGPSVGRVLDAVDALVISGGADVDPARYGAAAHPRTDHPRPERDAWESALVLAALDRDLPVLAICRGVQLLNVALGGSLHQHVPELTATSHGGAAGVFARVEVAVEPASRLGRLLGRGGGRLAVHCHHHQAIDRAGRGLVVVARTADGLVEAVESPDHSFAVGVQWHPEQDRTDRRLFEALVAAVRAG